MAIASSVYDAWWAVNAGPIPGSHVCARAVVAVNTNRTGRRARVGNRRDRNVMRISSVQGMRGMLHPCRLGRLKSRRKATATLLSRLWKMDSSLAQQRSLDETTIHLANDRREPRASPPV